MKLRWLVIGLLCVAVVQGSFETEEDEEDAEFRDPEPPKQQQQGGPSPEERKKAALEKEREEVGKLTRRLREYYKKNSPESLSKVC
jgi:hypothetical protein